MIEDLRSFLDGTTISCDLCIIGAGAAGITLAMQLQSSGLRLCLLESGGALLEPDTQALYAGDSIGHPMELNVGRYRLFGGSTSRWSGRCTPLDPIDFEARDWVAHSGWPIDSLTLVPFYPRAQAMCGFAGSWQARDALIQALLLRQAPFRDGVVDHFAWHYVPRERRFRLDFAAAHRGALAASDRTRLVQYANVVGFETTGDRTRVTAVLARSLSGIGVRVAARAVVLCCGGIENARLLLDSTRSVAGGIGNAHDMVGRCFMQHPRGRLAQVEATPLQARRLQRVFNFLPRKAGPEYEFGFALPARMQREHRLLNASAFLIYHPAAQNSWRAGKALLADLHRRRLGRSTARHVGTVLGAPGDLLRNGWGRLAQGQPLVLSLDSICLEVDLEQAPDPQSRVMLSQTRDAVGNRRAIVDWKVSEQERQTARMFTHLIQGEFERLDLGRVMPHAWLDETGPITEDALCRTHHHIGTTRMASEPSAGVVDRDCRVFGTRNLFVAGCSVFPTGGHANPTLTIVALAIRLADHLATVLPAGQVEKALHV